MNRECSLQRSSVDLWVEKSIFLTFPGALLCVAGVKRGDNETGPGIRQTG